MIHDTPVTPIRLDTIVHRFRARAVGQPRRTAAAPVAERYADLVETMYVT